MDRESDELRAFKSEINLTEYAASVGFELDRQASSRKSAVMRHVSGEKIIVARQPDGHFVYCSIHDSADPGGTIIDFVEYRQGISLGQVRQLLRPWIGTAGASPRPRIDPRHFVEALEPASRDFVAVRSRFESMRPVEPDNPYLVQERRIPAALLGHPKLLGTIRTDDRGNVCFAHTDGVDSLTVCGFEVKNRGFTGFASGGTKGLWSTIQAPGDTRLSIAESALDAISHAAIRGIDGIRLISIAGQMNAQQPALLRAAMNALPPRGCVFAAMDHDAGGEALAAKVHAVFSELGRADLTFVVDLPPTPGSDWNDELRSRASCGPMPSPG